MHAVVRLGRRASAGVLELVETLSHSQVKRMRVTRGLVVQGWVPPGSISRVYTVLESCTQILLSHLRSFLLFFHPVLRYHVAS
jgi:hypothetical protein